MKKLIVIVFVFISFNIYSQSDSIYFENDIIEISDNDSSDWIRGRLNALIRAVNDSIPSERSNEISDSLVDVASDIEANLDSIQTRWDMDADTVSQTTKHVKVKTLNSEYHVITYAASITFNGDNGMNQKVTLTGNVSSCTFSNLKDGATYKLKVIQDAGGTNTFDVTGLDNVSNETATFSVTGDDYNLFVIDVDSGVTSYSISTYTP